ncbi:MAG: SGNH/GDSL hydrolase family protein [Kiritimatiellae bacterium]|nr:SGNH/GDSL hydrolase family protein [Kiritimatiellia bacterium]
MSHPVSCFLFAALFAVSAALADNGEIAKFDPRMAVESGIVGADGLLWIDGRNLPLEGKCFTNTDAFYDRLPANVTAKVNGGVRSMKHHSSGLQFRFTTTSPTVSFTWVPYDPKRLSMDHMPSTGVSGIDVYTQDAAGRWRYLATGRVPNNFKDALSKGALPKCVLNRLTIKPGTPILVNLPLYNGIREFKLGIAKGSTVSALPPRKSGVSKPVVFYGTSITHGGCCSRPGMAFVNIVGRDLDVPVVNLGFSGSGVMEFEMSEHLAAIDASCYVLDCLWNMGMTKASDVKNRRGRNVDENYEPFIRNLRAKRPDVPIVMAERCDVYCRPQNSQDKCIRALYEKLVAEGWKNLVYLPKDKMYTGDLEGTVDGVHPNDWGMMSMSKAFGAAVKQALNLK